MLDYEETFITAGGAPGCSETAAPLDDCLIVGGYVLADSPEPGRLVSMALDFRGLEEAA